MAQSKGQTARDFLGDVSTVGLKRSKVLVTAVEIKCVHCGNFCTSPCHGIMGGTDNWFLADENVQLTTTDVAVKCWECNGISKAKLPKSIAKIRGGV